MGWPLSNPAATELPNTGPVGLKGANMLCSVQDGPDAQLPHWSSLSTAEGSLGCDSLCRIPSESELPSPCDMVGPCLQTPSAQKKGKQQPLPGWQEQPIQTAQQQLEHQRRHPQRLLRKHPVGQAPPRHEAALPAAKAVPTLLSTEAPDPAAGLAGLRERGRAALVAVGQDPPTSTSSPSTALPRQHQQPPAQQQRGSAWQAQHLEQPAQGPAEARSTEETRHLARLRQELEEVEEQSAQQWQQQQQLAQMAQQWQERLQLQALRDHAVVRQQWHEQWLLSEQHQHHLQWPGRITWPLDSALAEVAAPTPLPAPKLLPAAPPFPEEVCELRPQLPPAVCEQDGFFEILPRPPPGLEGVQPVPPAMGQEKEKSPAEFSLGIRKVDPPSSSELARCPAISQAAAAAEVNNNNSSSSTEGVNMPCKL
ncbi:unnamed protein product [Polarella glacialis]|uniref:Uncharacterized protein n=1 Tax=Polarella glacialis TaxID=89957 RepID=A0A813GS71_POLGL|nr:unnamed protein product [Polarella glacialis]CAE8658541.1 unnamed protein product [Polarella glacialis]